MIARLLAAAAAAALFSGAGFAQTGTGGTGSSMPDSRSGSSATGGSLGVPSEPADRGSRLGSVTGDLPAQCAGLVGEARERCIERNRPAGRSGAGAGTSEPRPLPGQSGTAGSSSGERR